MRATVTIPDELFEEADRVAERLGVSRSRLYQEALSRHLRAVRESALTQSVNEYVAKHKQPVDERFMRYLRKAWQEDMGDDEW